MLTNDSFEDRLGLELDAQVDAQLSVNAHPTVFCRLIEQPAQSKDR